MELAYTIESLVTAIAGILGSVIVVILLIVKWSDCCNNNAFFRNIDGDIVQLGGSVSTIATQLRTLFPAEREDDVSQR
jgi:hypothetical protein